MLAIIVTDVATGSVISVQPLEKYDPIIREFDSWCAKYARNSNFHTLVTLWDTETNMSHGSREVNVPTVVAPTTEEIRKFIRDECRVELDENRKIAAIKKTRERFCKNGSMLGLKEAKEHVEAVLLEEKAARLMSLPKCGKASCKLDSCKN